MTLPMLPEIDRGHLSLDLEARPPRRSPAPGREDPCSLVACVTPAPPVVVSSRSNQLLATYLVGIPVALVDEPAAGMPVVD